HLRAQVLEVVHRRHREVALLVAHLVALVRLLGRALFARVPEARLGVDEVETAVRILVEAHAVEEEELELGPDEDRVREARLLQIAFGLFRDVPRVARIPFARDGILHVTDDDEPSNPSPSVKMSSDSSEIGIEKCCQRPGRSMKRRSTNCAPLSFANLRTSFGVIENFLP